MDTNSGRIRIFVESWPQQWSDLILLQTPGLSLCSLTVPKESVGASGKKRLRPKN